MATNVGLQPTTVDRAGFARARLERGVWPFRHALAASPINPAWFDDDDMPETPAMLVPADTFKMTTILLPGDVDGLSDDGLYPFIQDAHGRFVVGPPVVRQKIVQFLERAPLIMELDP